MCDSESSKEEIPLNGGNSNHGVVRIGDTVRRATSKASSSVHRLLQFLESQGFDEAPKYLGIDEQGRETLTYLEGECTLQPAYWVEEGYLYSAAKLLKRYHDVSAKYVSTSDDKFAYEYPDSLQHEVICHNDFGPYNLVANNGLFTSVIDFDFAGPGPRIRDVAYAAYWLVPLSQCAEDMKQAALEDLGKDCARLKQFCALCGVPADSALLDMLSEVLAHMASEEVARDMIGPEVAAQLKAEGHLDHWSNEYAAFCDYRSSIEKKLLC